MTIQDVSVLIESLENIARAAPGEEEARRRLYLAAQRLTTTLESPADTIQRIAYLGLTMAVVRIGVDLNLFEILSERKAASMSVNELAERTGADYMLINRLLRSLASYEIIKEVGEKQYAATRITHSLADPGNMAGIKHNFDTVLPAWLALPPFLAATSYLNPTNPTACAFQKAHSTPLPAFDWLHQHPSNFSDFNLWMTTQHGGQQSWLDVFPFATHLGTNLTPSTPLFVDIGGGVGHQCRELKSRLGHLPGRVILQDQAPVLAQALRDDGVEPMAYDFATPQPVRGARAYYLRNVLHDYPDDKCAAILRNTMAAMGPDSVILVDEMILPNEGASWRATQLDLTMMACLASMERSEREWGELYEKVGLRVLGVWRYAEETGDSVVMLRPIEGVTPAPGSGVGVADIGV